MVSGLNANVEMKPKWWFKPLVNITAFLYDSNLIQEKTVEGIFNRVMNRAFRFRIDKGKWQKIDVPYHIEFE